MSQPSSMPFHKMQPSSFARSTEKQRDCLRPHKRPEHINKRNLTDVIDLSDEILEILVIRSSRHLDLLARLQQVPAVAIWREILLVNELPEPKTLDVQAMIFDRLPEDLRSVAQEAPSAARPAVASHRSGLAAVQYSVGSGLVVGCRLGKKRLRITASAPCSCQFSSFNSTAEIDNGCPVLLEIPWIRQPTCRPGTLAAQQQG